MVDIDSFFETNAVKFTQPVSYQSYFFKGEYETIKTTSETTNEDILTFQLRYELQIESSRQF